MLEHDVKKQLSELEKHDETLRDKLRATELLFSDPEFRFILAKRFSIVFGIGMLIGLIVGTWIGSSLK